MTSVDDEQTLLRESPYGVIFRILNEQAEQKEKMRKHVFDLLKNQGYQKYIDECINTIEIYNLKTIIKKMTDNYENQSTVLKFFLIDKTNNLRQVSIFRDTKEIGYANIFKISNVEEDCCLAMAICYYEPSYFYSKGDILFHKIWKQIPNPSKMAGHDSIRFKWLVNL